MIQRKAFKKWLFITSLCGAHSFLWGALCNGNPAAMVLGVLTIVLMFASIESHATYQKKRAAAPRLARAMDAGVKFRCWLAVYIPLSLLFMSVFDKTSSWVFAALKAPYMGEVTIGAGALQLTQWFSGIELGNARGMDNFIATYFTTIFTGLAHTVILAVLCLLVYGVVCLRSCAKPVAVDDGAAKE